MNIDLTNPLALPTEFVLRLKAIENICKNYQYSESLVESSEVISLVRDVDGYCRNNRIIGLHFTRANKESISTKDC